MTVSTKTMLMRAVAGVVCCTTLAFTNSGLQAQQSASSQAIQLDESNYGAWRDHVLPKSAELDWQQIPWLSTFKDGLLAANESQKPLLLWTMNGHPLGCT